ncbi:hypothetical protein V6N11_036723 [Hibiscus sabdariffa]|uniref:Uncharacterized protein n=1 Tax=Hibiscus sabdariffa TaxID=183260 RepID=A0ABR2RB76_9ROSI
MMQKRWMEKSNKLRPYLTAFDFSDLSCKIWKSGCSGCVFLFVGCCWDFGLNDGLMKLDEGWLLGSLGGEGSVSAGGDGSCCGLKGGQLRVASWNLEVVFNGGGSW